MPILFWDASSLSKRYTREHGSDSVDILFTHPSVPFMLFSHTGWIEAYGILRRRLNAGIVRQHNFAAARSLLRRELMEDTRFHLIPIEDYFLEAVAMIDRHNLNATDAMILTAYLEYRQTIPAAGQPAVLVASDHRLLRAAQAEGLPVLDPEAIAAGDVTAYLASL